MTDPEQQIQERGIFKQLVLALWCAFIWCEIQVIKAWKSELFWLSVSLLCIGYAIGTIIACKWPVR